MNDKLILVVEDNPDHLELTVLTLEEQGVTAEIAVARDGVQALDYLFGQGSHAGRDTQRQPSFILLDMKLPKLSGLDVLRSLRATRSRAGAGRHADVLERAFRHRGLLPGRRQRLCPQARGFRGPDGKTPAAPGLLAGRQ
jgi:CheY-like chemotaxis protein